MAGKSSNITDQQEDFCQQYVIDKNATRAAEDSGYAKKTAASQGSRLLKNVKVQARIRELLAEQQKRTEITADSVLREIGSYAFKTREEDTEDNISMKGLELLGRHFGTFNDKMTHQFDFSTKTDEELRLIIEEGT